MSSEDLVSLDDPRLDPEFLRCAAYLGHAPARERLADPPAIPADLRDWVLGLDDWGDEISVRALVALATMRLGHDLAIPNGAISTAEHLLKCPCPVHERRARKAWAPDAPWTDDVEWAELAAELSWETSWKTSEDQVRQVIREALVPWVLQQRA